MTITITLIIFVITVLLLLFSNGSNVAAEKSYFEKDSNTIQYTNNGVQEKALFGGGCFWCLEPAFENLEGVVKVVVGYAGGQKSTADYYKVSSGATEHYETVMVTYSPQRISYERLLETFWSHIDPTDDGGQYDDRGRQYRTAIFYYNEKQRTTAHRSRRQLMEKGHYESPIATTIESAPTFYLAEERHQNFFEKKYSHTKVVK